MWCSNAFFLTLPSAALSQRKRKFGSRVPLLSHRAYKWAQWLCSVPLLSGGGTDFGTDFSPDASLDQRLPVVVSRIRAVRAAHRRVPCAVVPWMHCCCHRRRNHHRRTHLAAATYTLPHTIHRVASEETTLLAHDPPLAFCCNIWRHICVAAAVNGSARRFSRYPSVKPVCLSVAHRCTIAPPASAVTVRGCSASRRLRRWRRRLLHSQARAPSAARWLHC